jgi:hypothetical protein
MGDAKQEDPATGGPAGETGRSTADLPEGVRRRLADVFGDVLPDVTRDEAAAPEESTGTAMDDWLRANRPPHHGG